MKFIKHSLTKAINTPTLAALALIASLAMMPTSASAGSIHVAVPGISVGYYDGYRAKRSYRNRSYYHHNYYYGPSKRSYYRNIRAYNCGYNRGYSRGYNRSYEYCPIRGGYYYR